jgi:hypothetical protein
MMKKLNLKSLVIGSLAGVMLMLVSGFVVVQTLEAGSFQTTTLVVDGEVYLITTNTKTSVVKVHHVTRFGEPPLHTRAAFSYEWCMFPQSRNRTMDSNKYLPSHKPESGHRPR